MRALPLILITVFCLNAQTAAPRTELFGGYSFLNLKPGASLDRASLNGWHTSLTHYVVGRLGVSADISGHYGSVDLPRIGAGLSAVDADQHSFLAGPTVRLFQRRRFMTGFRAIVGVARGKTRNLGPVSPAELGLDLTDTWKLAASFGSAIDFPLSQRVAVRVQPNVFLTRFGRETERNVRFSTGIVFRLGSGE